MTWCMTAFSRRSPILKGIWPKRRNLLRNGNDETSVGDDVCRGVVSDTWRQDRPGPAACDGRPFAALSRKVQICPPAHFALTGLRLRGGCTLLQRNAVVAPSVHVPSATWEAGFLGSGHFALPVPEEGKDLAVKGPLSCSLEDAIDESPTTIRFGGERASTENAWKSPSWGWLAGIERGSEWAG